MLVRIPARKWIILVRIPARRWIILVRIYPLTWIMLVRMPGSCSWEMTAFTFSVEAPGLLLFPGIPPSP